ncbi:ACP S-malonyltransferase [Roseobacter weihaiensis]|uniref:ACP S-malonyltransferase n=1 Tax=Roseobacter weihaiensis TaxID=2763262 RepID=UPI001D0B9D1B|nr:ACP S-malonyltransferase [Roseobacter sp. H9]
MNRTAVLICPGRGTYNTTELGYIHRHHADEMALIRALDARRRSARQTPLQDLDGATRFTASRHTRGDNAAPLIFAASLLDARRVGGGFDIVGVTGNSMGWYTALTVGGATEDTAGFDIVNTMGRLMHESLIGGQMLYPFVDDNWQPVPGLRHQLLDRIAEIDSQPGNDLAVSIHLGGMLVVAGNAAGLRAFEKDLPVLQGRYPMRLPNHAAFHTALQAPVAVAGRAALGLDLFGTPRVPLVDGRGVVWYPKACTARDLRDYTLGTQVTEPYDFTAAVQVAARSFAPDVFIITGPGDTLGGAVAQALIEINWKGLDSKAGFQAKQRKEPLILSMGRAQDRAIATAERV